MKKAPKQKRSLELVSSLMEAGTRILSSVDPAQLTVENLAKKAGVGIGSVYDYFSSKDSILSALLDRQIDENLSRIFNLLEDQRGRDRDTALAALARAMADQYLSNRKQLNLGLFRLAPFLGRLPRISKARMDVHEKLAEILQSLDPPLAAEAARKASILIVNAAAGILQGAALGALPPELLEPGEALDTVISGIVAQSERR